MKPIKLTSFALIAFITASCSVGTKVMVESAFLEYPVSQSSIVYVPDGRTLDANSYQEITDFSYRFKRWGNSTLNIDPHVDLSGELNQIVEKSRGNAIVNLEISTRNTASNSIMLFLKSVAILGTAFGGVLSVTEPTIGSVGFTAASFATYLLIPANLDVEVRGTIIKILYQ
jgi:hypothetical protein